MQRGAWTEYASLVSCRRLLVIWDLNSLLDLCQQLYKVSGQATAGT